MSRRGEAIYHRKDGLWEARYVKGLDATGKKKYASVYAHSYREAKERRQDIVSKITLLPQSISSRRICLNELILEWLFLNQGRIKPSTYQKYSSQFENHIKDTVGKYQIIYLTPVLFKQYSDGLLKKKLSATTVNGILTFIRTCLKYGNRQYGTPSVDMVYLKPPRKEMRVLSLQEQNKLVQFLLLDTDIYKLGVLLTLYTGIRIGELCALTWGDIKEGKLTINKTMQRLSKGVGNGTELVIGEPKTVTSNRTIPLPSFLAEFIEKHRRADRYRFLSTPEKSIADPRTMQNLFHKYIRTLGFPKANFHSLRHTFATRCTEAGFEIKSLSEILGHSNVSITLGLYVHSSFELKADNMEKLSLFL